MGKLFRLHSMAILGLVMLALLLAPSVFSAQDSTSQCPVLVEKALSELGQNCDTLDRNSACYGFNRVEATFGQEVDANTFSQPSDRAGLKELATIETAPLDVDQNYWGIAVLNVQANVPNTLPGQAVTFLLVGDVQMENAVAPEDAFQPGEPITVRAVVGVNIRSAPSANANVVGSAPQGTELPADALSSDGRWLRAIFEGGVGWVSREVVDWEGDIGTLPTLSEETRSPMQAFTFRTTAGQLACNEAPPSLLVVQGPENIKVDITANGADIRLGSTIALRILEGNKVQLMVIDGEAQIGNLTIPAGFTIFGTLDENGQIIPDDWTDFKPLSPEELEELKGLEDFPVNILHYPIRIPTLEDIQAALRAFSQTSSLGEGSEGPAAGKADCSGFKPTSPLDGLPFGLTSFYWDPAPGATSYRVNLYDEANVFKTSYDVAAPNTSLIGDTSGLGAGFVFSWEVQALVDGEVACTSGRATMLREASIEADTGGGPSATSTPSGICNFNRICEPRRGENARNCSDC